MKDIEGYEGLYAVTSCGRVWSYRSKKFLRPYITKDGYLRVALCHNYKNQKYLVHRLVAIAYIPNPNNYDSVDHINFNRKDNNINNLQWMPHSDNSAKQQRNMKIKCIELNRIFNSQMDAARELNISQGDISMVLNGKRDIAGGYHWKKEG